MVLSFPQGHSLCLDKSGDSRGLAGRPLEGLIQRVLSSALLETMENCPTNRGSSAVHLD